MKKNKIVEGSTEIIVPAEKERNLTKKDPVFYNPHMKLNRDLSIAFSKVFQPDEYCDLLAGTGIKGVRIGNETSVEEIVINDLNPKAYELIKENIRHNSLGEKAKAENKNANLLLMQQKFQHIDVDPFGPPVKFVGNAIESVVHTGTLAFTATDTAALAGTYPNACKRKYRARSLRTDYYNELGLRILTGYLIGEGWSRGTHLKPLFSHCSRHYFRIYFQVLKSESTCNKHLDKMKYLQHCYECLERKYQKLDELEKTCRCGREYETAGPLWSGKLAQPQVCEKMSRHSEEKIIPLIGKEQTIQKPYYNLHKIFQKNKMPPLATDKVINKLEEKGFEVEQTHFLDLGIRTNAEIKEINDILPEMQ